jgi:signal transduction histidine kinase
MPQHEQKAENSGALLALRPRPPEPVEVAAYYLVSEALTNILKHSDATSAGVSVARRGTQLVVEVADDGAGGADRDTGSGLRGLADRIEALGGHLEVSSPPGAGTRLRAEIPLEQGRHQPTKRGRDGHDLPVSK